MKQSFEIYTTAESIPKIEAQAAKDFEAGLLDANPYHKSLVAHHVYEMAIKQLQHEKTKVKS